MNAAQITFTNRRPRFARHGKDRSLDPKTNERATRLNFSTIRTGHNGARPVLPCSSGPPTASRQSDKTTASQDQARQSSTCNRAGDSHSVEDKGRVKRWTRCRSGADDVGADPQPIGRDTSIFFVKQPYASSITTFHNARARFGAFASDLATFVARSAGSSRVEWTSKKPKFGLQRMGNAPKITRRAFFLGKCHRVVMVACLNNVKLSVVLPRQEAALEPRNAS